MKRAAFAALLAAIVIGAPASAQGGRSGRGGMMRPPENQVAWLITKKADWAGTDDQVAKLTEIAKKFDDENKDALAAIKAALPPEGTNPGDLTDEQRQAMMAKMQELRPQMQAIRDKNQSAVEAALLLLNADQQEKAKALLAERFPAGRGGRGRGN